MLDNSYIFAPKINISVIAVAAPAVCRICRSAGHDACNRDMKTDKQ